MNARSFVRDERQISVGEIAKLTGAQVLRGADPQQRIAGIASLDRAGPADLVFIDDRKHSDQLRNCAAGACLTDASLAEFVPFSAALLVTEEPFVAFVAVARALYPGSLRPSSLSERAGVDASVLLHASARLEDGITIKSGVVIGPGVEIGSGTVIGANAVIGRDVRIGRDCRIGPNTSVAFALIGDRVVLHPGCMIGQAGFGYLAAAGAHHRIPHVGRVIIQDDVEIGAGTSVDRGGLGDTVIGDGCKVDNQVHVGHNVVVGRHCLVGAQTGISGNAVLEDRVVLGQQVGIADGLTIGEGAKIGAKSAIVSDIPARRIV